MVFSYKSAFYSSVVLLVIVLGYFFLFDKPYQLVKVNSGFVQRLNRATGESKVYEANSDIPTVQEELELAHHKAEVSKWHVFQKGLLIRWNEVDSSVRAYIFLPKNKLQDNMTLQFWDQDGFSIDTGYYNYYLSRNLNKKDFSCGEKDCHSLTKILYVDYKIYQRMHSATIADSKNQQISFADSSEYDLDMFLINLNKATAKE